MASNGTRAQLPRIAYVDDQADHHSLIEIILEDMYTVDCYFSGPEMFEALTAGKIPDLIFLDISIPGMDGPDILGRLRETGETRETPIVALTAHTMKGDREKYLAMGFDDYISKPFSEGELIAILKRWIPQKG